jgi:predicted transcriptional regulator of viral defense system
MTRRSPGVVRDTVLRILTEKHPDGAKLDTIMAEARAELGNDLSPSSVRSYLRLNTPGTFERLGRGHYRIRRQR